MSFCLDSWAVLAWLDGNPRAQQRVDELLPARPVMSWINAVEVYYRVKRDHGRHEADEVLAGLKRTLVLELPTTSRMVEAGRIKAKAAIALADCFALATAAAHRAVLLTGDPEIIDLPGREAEVEDLRA